MAAIFTNKERLPRRTEVGNPKRLEALAAKQLFRLASMSQFGARGAALGDSFLLKIFVAVTNAWVTKYSLIAIPLLRRATRPEPELQRNRDVFIFVMLALSMAMVVWFHFAGDVWRRAIAALALYRILDLLISWSRTGVTLNFRGDVPLAQEPVWRVQRTLLGAILNYVELVLWFTIVYRQLSITSDCQFSALIERMDQAFDLSVSTMTTIGYGKYAPDGPVSNVLAFLQAFLGIILMVLVVASALTLIIDHSKTSSASLTAAGPSPQVTSVLPTSGSASGGDTVEITGTGFTGASSVDFGGVASTQISVRSDSRITVTSPPGSPGLVEVTVTTPSGKSSAPASRFTYYRGAGLGAWLAPLVCFAVMWSILFWTADLRFWCTPVARPEPITDKLRRLEAENGSLRQDVAAEREARQEVSELIARFEGKLATVQEQLAAVQTVVEALAMDRGNRKIKKKRLSPSRRR